MVCSNARLCNNNKNTQSKNDEQNIIFETIKVWEEHRASTYLRTQWEWQHTVCGVISLWKKKKWYGEIFLWFSTFWGWCLLHHNNELEHMTHTHTEQTKMESFVHWQEWNLLVRSDKSSWYTLIYKYKWYTLELVGLDLLDPFWFSSGLDNHRSYSSTKCENPHKFRFNMKRKPDILKKIRKSTSIRECMYFSSSRK